MSGRMTAGQSRRISRGRWVHWAERAVLLVLGLFLFGHTMPRAWKGLVTDFPNYYLAAQLAHEGVDTSRMYEWNWLEREKDHRDIPIRVIGLVPITPFSTLFMWPLTALKPLAAKRVWIILSLALLVPIGWMLRAMTGLSYQRIALLFALNFPLYRNLEFGQFYVVLLLLMVAACWAYMRGQYAVAGGLVAIAAAAKIFPVLFFVFFLQRRSWRALASGALVAAACAILSVAAFGWSVHRIYLEEILPWAVHGDAMPPYVVNASISGILHFLFLNEPQWNPHPWHLSVLAYSVLQPLLQMLVLAPVVLLIRREDGSPRRIMLEWSALLTASLAISTIPASYNFVLMVLPACVLGAILLERGRYGWLVALVVAYIGIGFPMPNPSHVKGLEILLYTPRFPLMIGVLAGTYALLWFRLPARGLFGDWSRIGWAAAMAVSVIFTVHSTFVRERAVRQEYAYRLGMPFQGYLNKNPQSSGTGIDFIAFTLDGYHLMSSDGKMQSTGGDLAVGAGDLDDDLSFASGGGHLFVERAGAAQSSIVDLQQDLQRPAIAGIADGRDPALSADATILAFVRDDHGRGRLTERPILRANSAGEIELTPAALNVFEATFRSSAYYAFAASEGDRPPQIYLTSAAGSNMPLGLGESRYPAISPDGRWMGYSRFDGGAWNLWIRDQNTGATQRIGNVPCNEIQPSWESDSKTLLYSTDCGRSLGFTAVARRRVIP
jgi:Glycosyltransferase family 87/WD40-like Beta Propeller Repeat